MAIGRTESCTRIGISKFYQPIVKIDIEYTDVRLERRYLLPWVKNFSSEIYHLRVKAQLKSGRIISKIFVFEGTLKLALEYAYLKGVQNTLETLRGETVAEATQAKVG